MTNENNYIGATSTVVAYAASDARYPAYDREGAKGILEVALPVNEGYKRDGEFVQTGTTWYTLVAAGDAAADLKHIKKGDKVRVDDAKQEVREYTDREGNSKLGISLRFGKITVLESKSAGDGFVPEGDGDAF
jgi:hypothetical protein